MFVRIGNYTFNLNNVTEIIDYGDRLAICFMAAWPNPNHERDGYDTAVSCRNLTGEDAEAMRKYIGRLADDAAAQIR
jgi:hypothetical protein